jgi:YD repeat-containing protein
MPEFPTIITTTNSDNSVEFVRNYYPTTEDINALASELSSEEIFSYNILKNNNLISEPIQINNFNDQQILSKTRIIYKVIDQLSNVAFKYKIQFAKTNQALEDRIIYHQYDSRGNPMELSLADGTSIVYIWDFQRRPLYKIVNASYNQVILALSNSNILINENFSGLFSNTLINQLPNAQISTFLYNPVNNLLSEVIDAKGDIQTYHYDSFNRLQFVKDAQGNILSENEYHYKN